MPFSETFWISFYIATFGFIGTMLTVIYKSKCSHVECCCFKIDRDVVTEEKFDEISLKIPKSPKSTTSLNIMDHV